MTVTLLGQRAAIICPKSPALVAGPHDGWPIFNPPIGPVACNCALPGNGPIWAPLGGLPTDSALWP